MIYNLELEHIKSITADEFKTQILTQTFADNVLKTRKNVFHTKAFQKLFS